MRDAGTFTELGDIFKKTLPFCEMSLEAFVASPTVETAIGLRQACILACTAGDGLANVRCAEVV